MEQCPQQATAYNCGLQAAQELINERAIIIDPFDGFGESVRIDENRLAELDILIPGDYRAEGQYDVADFCCVACGKAVQVLSSKGNMLATNASDIRTN